MYIYPNTTLKILHNVYLNNDYDHTIFFNSLSDQEQFFGASSKVKYTLNNQQYQRKERGWIQVNLNQNDLWDCTYLMYRNTSYFQKWFYAFILSVEYVNDGVSRINFEIDVMQTWHFNYNLDKCFVEREHSETDNLYEHTLDEKLDIGELYYNAQIIRNFLFNPSRLLVIATTANNGVHGTPVMNGNAFTGAYYMSYDLSDTSSGGGRETAIATLEDYIQNGLEDNIILIMQYPDFMGRYTTQSSYTSEPYTFTPNTVNIDGYIPKNKKLFCFPYNYLNVTDKEGKSIDYKFELWNNSYVGYFNIEGTIIGKPTVQIYPRFYKDIDLDYEDGITYDNFPICAWVGDSYQIWLAQRSTSFYVHNNMALLTGGLNSLVGAFSGNALRTARGLMSVGSAVADRISTTKEAGNMPSKLHGDVASSLLNIQNGSCGFQLKQMTIRNEYAKIIDEYFSRFGYACHRIKVPNRNARQNWTYTKTVGCEINGNIPSDDIVKIKEIFDHGVTFWNNGNSIGYYGDFTNPVYS